MCDKASLGLLSHLRGIKGNLQSCADLESCSAENMNLLSYGYTFMIRKNFNETFMTISYISLEKLNSITVGFLVFCVSLSCLLECIPLPGEDKDTVTVSSILQRYYWTHKYTLGSLEKKKAVRFSLFKLQK